MYFSTAISLVKEKIKGNKELTEKFKKMLKENKILKHQNDNMVILNRSSKVLGEIIKVTELAKVIVSSNAEFMKKNQLTSNSFKNENNKLLEAFDISIIGKYIPTKLDLALDLSISAKENKKLLESYLNTMSNNTKKLLKESKENKLSFLNERFSNILSKEELINQTKIIEFLSEKFDNKNKEFINESISKIDRESLNIKSIQKTHDLRLLVENLLLEFQTDDEETDEAVVKRTSGSKVSVLTDLKYIKGIKILTPYNWKSPDKIEIKFQIPVYPVGAYYVDIVESALKVKRKLDRFHRSFINLFIYQKERTGYFEPTESIWDVLIRTNGIKPGSAVNAKLDIYLNVNKKGNYSFSDLEKEAYKLLKDFDRFLPIMFEDELTDKFQKLAMKSKDAEGRSRRQRNLNTISKQNQSDEDKGYDLWIGKGDTKQYFKK